MTAPRKRARGRPSAAKAVAPADLVNAAMVLVEQHGVDALTARRVAKVLKLSHNAPIYYFGSADGLLAAVASAGFDRLEEQLTRPPLPGDGIARVHELVRRYVRFGVLHEHLYRAMFHRRLAPLLEGTLPLHANAQRLVEGLSAKKHTAYRILVESLVLLDKAKQLRAGHPEELALALAALAHGIVGEFIDEGLWSDRGRSGWTSLRDERTATMTSTLLFGLVKDAPSRAHHP